MTKQDKDRLLTDTELEFMQVIWERGEATVNDVRESLGDTRHLAYTSVSTILRILEKKEILRSEKQGRSHTYVPLLSRDAYEERSLKHLITNVFTSKTALVRRLVETGGLSGDELAEIRNLIDREDGQ